MGGGGGRELCVLNSAVALRSHLAGNVMEEGFSLCILILISFQFFLATSGILNSSSSSQGTNLNPFSVSLSMPRLVVLLAFAFVVHFFGMVR